MYYRSVNRGIIRSTAYFRISFKKTGRALVWLVGLLVVTQLLLGYSDHDNSVSHNDNTSLLQSPTLSSNSHFVLVFIHIQKTGGRYIEKHLTKQGGLLDPDRRCACHVGTKICNCTTPDGRMWLVSRFSTGWMCGLHADFTETTECLTDHIANMQKKEELAGMRYKYFSVFRNAEDRFLSEWAHVQRGGTWEGAKIRCNHRRAGSKDYQPCHTIRKYMTEGAINSTWSNVRLHTFLSCPYNLANNRQTRMMSNLSHVDCYDNFIDWNSPDSLRNQQLRRILLHSAKRNTIGYLQAFGLLDYPLQTQYLLQHSLGITFRYLFPTSTHSDTRSSEARSKLTSRELKLIGKMIRLDVDFYLFITRLFVNRLTIYLLHDWSLSFRNKRPLSNLFRHGNYIGLHDSLKSAKSILFLQRLLKLCGSQREPLNSF